METHLNRCHHLFTALTFASIMKLSNQYCQLNFYHKCPVLLGGGLSKVRVLYLCAGLEGNGRVLLAEVLQPALKVVSGNQVSLVEHQDQLFPGLASDG